MKKYTKANANDDIKHWNGRAYFSLNVWFEITTSNLIYITAEGNNMNTMTTAFERTATRTLTQSAKTGEQENDREILDKDWMRNLRCDVSSARIARANSGWIWIQFVCLLCATRHTHTHTYT